MRIRLRMVVLLAALMMATGNPCVLMARAEEKDMQIPDAEPLFRAWIEYSFEGYVVKSTFEFTSDMSRIQLMYSLDGEIWKTCDREGDWYRKSQICLYDSFEPLKSYLAGKVDSFYLKWRITEKNGRIYDTKPAFIDRGTPLPAPEELTFTATFVSSMRVFERNPYCYYGRYQLTVKADATKEEIEELLPDTLPLEVQIQKGKDYVANGIVDCPVVWRSIVLPPLTVGESVTIPNVAEALIVPAGTLVSTPVGVFQLEEPLGIAQDRIVTDEVRLVLNVVSDGKENGENVTEVFSGGAGGNEGNAGTDNRKDSTAEGQRPNLPRNPQVQQPDVSQNPENGQERQQADVSQNPGNMQEAQQSYLQQSTQNEPKEQQPELSLGIVSQLEEPVRPNTSANAGFGLNQQPMEDEVFVNRFEASAQLLAADTIADICISALTVRIKANLISGRMVSQIIGILNINFFIS